MPGLTIHSRGCKRPRPFFAPSLREGCKKIQARCFRRKPHEEFHLRRGIATFPAVAPRTICPGNVPEPVSVQKNFPPRSKEAEPKEARESLPYYIKIEWLGCGLSVENPPRPPRGPLEPRSIRFFPARILPCGKKIGTRPPFISAPAENGSSSSREPPELVTIDESEEFVRAWPPAGVPEGPSILNLKEFPFHKLFFFFP